MVQVLQNKKLATCFQILVAIAAGQPNIQQKSIAAGIGVPPQAVSEYVAELTRDYPLYQELRDILPPVVMEEKA